jgi:hypothetical protein
MGLLAYDYPLLSIFWTMVMFFLWVIWIWVLVSILIDIFRSHDLGGFAKAMWLLFVIFLPVLGVLVYLIARGHKMQEHAVEQMQAQEKMFKAYVQQAAATGSTADELMKLASLRDKGFITVDEFDAQKARLLTA